MKNIIQQKDGLISEINESVILGLLIEEAPLSRRDISHKTGISQPMVSIIVSELIKQGLVVEKEKGRASSSGGRRPIHLDINEKGGYLVGVDLGSYKIKAVVTDLRHNILKKDSFLTPKKDLPPRLCNFLKKFLLPYPGEKIKGIAFGISGVVDRQKGEVIFSANIPSLNKVPLAKILEEELLFPIILDNTGDCWMLAERFFDPEVKRDNFMGIFWGNGLGLNVVIHEKILISGIKKSVWDFGHITHNKNGPLCGCGKRGCMEAYVGGWAIEKKVGESLIPLVKKAKEGDRRAQEIFREAGYILGEKLSSFLQFFSPQEVILIGGLTRMGEILLPAIKKGIKKVIGEEVKRYEFKITSLGEYGGALGATKLISHQIFKTPLLEMMSI